MSTVILCGGARSQSAVAHEVQEQTAAGRFEVVSIKPANPAGGLAGFVSYPGGRVQVGHASVMLLIHYAYDVEAFEIEGGPEWTRTERFEIEAVPPDSSPSRKDSITRATPTEEQRAMLRSMLAERFGLKIRRETKQGQVYELTRGPGKLMLEDTKHPDDDARGFVVMKAGGIADGEASGTNVSMRVFASQLSSNLHVPVIDQTGLTGRYDFHLEPDDPENHDYTAAVFGAMTRLGLKLKRGTGPVEMVVIDHVERPSEN